MKELNSVSFRKELKKIMPGYKWTVHRQCKYGPKLFIDATGIKTSGYNRLSTLHVVKRIVKRILVSGRKPEEFIEYTVKSSGFGLNAPWLSEYTDTTLARALRGLQNHYENMAQNYSIHASDLQGGRAIKSKP